MADVDVLDTREVDGVKYRVYLLPDEDAESPRDYDGNAGMIVCRPDRDYLWPSEDGDNVSAQEVGFAFRDEDSFGLHHEGRSFRAVARWLRMCHGATVVLPLYDASSGLSVGNVDDTPDAGDYVGVTFDQPSTREGIPEGHMVEALTVDVQEYARWATGEVYGYVVERQAPAAHPECHAVHAGEQWEQVDSLWALIGHEYAEKAALEAFDACTDRT
ncbi:MAG: hypothetical protein WA317_01495 [Mycobacterium sp.]|uniref:hypothetical protein n=1 Tax=Mycobacterium sp. TaxID=1785 RepID=UPI003CC65CE8